MRRLRLFFDQWINAISKFPLAYVILAVLTLTVIFLVHYQDAYPYGTFETDMQKILSACLVAFPLTIIPGLLSFIRKKKYNHLNELLLSGIWIVIWLLYYATLTEVFDAATLAQRISNFWWILIARAIPFFFIAWETRNKWIMTRTRRKSYKLSILFGLLGWAIIRGGISACIVSLEYLFDVKIDSNSYAYVGSVAMIFIAWSIWLIHLLQQNVHNTIQDYTRSMRIFGHYIFLPLTLVYGAILISYGIKILITGMWPQGTVVYMVIWYVAFGLATLYTTYPGLPDKRLSKAHNILFISFFLTSLLMVKAIRMRISQYWITADRYFVCMIIIAIMLLSIWSLLIPKYRHLVLITIAIGLGLITVYGWPFNAANTSIRSQKNTLRTTLNQNNISLPLQSWSLTQIASDDAGKAYWPISYLSNNGETLRTKDFFTTEQQSAIEKQDTYTRSDYIFTYVWLDHSNINGWYDSYSPQEYFSLTSNTKELTTDKTPVNIAWYNTLYLLESRGTSPANNTVTVKNNDSSYTINLQDYIAEIYTQTLNTQNNSSPYTITTDNVQLVLTEISGSRTNADTGTTYRIDYYRGYVLVR